MSSAAVTPSMRAVGWNVHFTIGQEEDPGAFAGIYQVAGSDLVTFRNVCDELRLCFEFPHGDVVPYESNDNNDNNDSWSSIAFALIDHAELPSFVTGEQLDRPVPSLPPLRAKEQNVLNYHLVHHTPCNLPSSSSLDTHLQARCARHLPNPKRRRDPRYLPPNETPPDPRLTLMPLRRKLKARSQSPPKRSASGSTTPRKNGPEDAADDDEFNNMLAPVSMTIDLEEARKVASDFRSSCLNRATCCALSGEGESWCPGSPIGPGIQACHIVPQQHYHLYPSTGGQLDGDDEPVEESPRRLQEAWRNTWSSRNGILLMTHLHQFFDARLISIHPRTLRIRVFVPYNALARFNGLKAKVPTNVDRKALRHHYEMCCIENMAAERPNLDAMSPNMSRIATSGTSTPFTANTDLPVTPSSTGTRMEATVAKTGDLSKRSWAACSEQSQQPMDAFAQDERAKEAQEEIQWKNENRHKRRRLENHQVDSGVSTRDNWLSSEGYITPKNSCQFLADVNWELQMFKSYHSASSSPEINSRFEDSSDAKLQSPSLEV